MKLLIMHLSDMHFKENDNYKDDTIKTIVSTLQQSIIGIEHLLIIVSGDCSFSGKKEESKKVASFFNILKKSIIQRYKIQDIVFAIVPGNHDVDNDKRLMDRPTLEMIDRDNNYKESISGEIDKQKEFYILANRFNCFPERTLLHQKILLYGKKKILLNLVNTAVFSAKTDEDQGFHYLPEADIEALTNQGDSDFVITVMHHPHHFFNWSCKKKLERAIYSHSDLIFVGHEHNESAQKIEDGEATVNIFAGGKLCNKGDWSNSEFHLAVLDLDTREYQTRRYVLSQSYNVYEEKEKKTIELSENRYNQLGLAIRSDFMKDLNVDKYAIAKSDQDYFVFPLLVEEYLVDDRGRLAKEVNSMDAFIEALFKEGKIIINGGSDSGKSILARSIFRKLAQKKVTLFVKGADVTNNFERTIRNAFEDVYSKEKVAYDEFVQMCPSDLAIVIDDVDYIDISKQNSFLEYIEEHFGTIVETCQIDIDIDVNIIDRLKKRASTRNYIFYRIAPFYSDKRRQLVDNIAHLILNDDPETIERIVSVLCDALTKQKYLYSLNPEFIVQFTKYYCKNIGEAMQNDGSVFSKVFEANLTNLIKPYARGISVEKSFIVLDKIAYYIYINGINAYPISLGQIDGVIQEYNTLFGSKISTREFLNILIEAKILKAHEEKFLFFDRNYLAYFAAREIRRKGVEDGDYTQFQRVMDNSYKAINADILLFVTYITDNRKIIEMIMNRAVQAVEKWKEFDLRETDISFLIKPPEEILRPVEEKDRKQEEHKKVEQEKREVKSLVVVNDASIFEGTDKEPELLDELIRAISLMIIVARILPSFEHMMQKPEKDKCVGLIYQMPQRIFEAWAKEVDSLTNELVREIKDYHEWEYRKEKPNYKPLEDRQALEILRTEATLMLLELMNTSIANATRDNVNEFIDAFPFAEKPTYSVEHLMSLRYRDNVGLFKKEAFRLIDEKEVLTRNLIRWVTRNYIVNSKNIKPNEMQSLNAKVLGEGTPHGRLLIEKNRNKKKY